MYPVHVISSWPVIGGRAYAVLELEFYKAIFHRNHPAKVKSCDIVYSKVHPHLNPLRWYWAEMLNMEIMNNGFPYIHLVLVKDKRTGKSKGSCKHANKHTTIIICFLLLYIIRTVYMKGPVPWTRLIICHKQCTPHLTDSSLVGGLDKTASCTHIEKVFFVLDELKGKKDKNDQHEISVSIFLFNHLIIFIIFFQSFSVFLCPLFRTHFSSKATASAVVIMLRAYNPRILYFLFLY